MEKEKRITAPYRCEIEKVELVNGVAVVTFKEKERQLPKSFEEFCEMFPDYTGEYFIEPNNKDKIGKVLFMDGEKREYRNAELLPDFATAEAVLALGQLIQLRNCYNGDWVPDFDNEEQEKYVITFVCCDEITITDSYNDAYSPLYFKNKEIADEFLRNFRPLIEKLKPLYGIKEGGEK
jgi:hypothetical protein